MVIPSSMFIVIFLRAIGPCFSSLNQGLYITYELVKHCKTLFCTISLIIHAYHTSEILLTLILLITLLITVKPFAEITYDTIRSGVILTLLTVISLSDS